MAITSYATLVTAVRDWLARDSVTLTDERLSDLVSVAEAEIWTRLRVREMEVSAAISISAQAVALPAGFLGMRRLYIAGNYGAELQFLAPPAFWGLHSGGDTGRPAYFTLEGENIVFGPAPDATYSGQVLYWARPASLESGNVSALFTRQPDIWLYGTLAHAAPFTGEDQRMPIWRAGFEAAMSRAMASDERERFGAGPLVMKAG